MENAPKGPRIARAPSGVAGYGVAVLAASRYGGRGAPGLFATIAGGFAAAFLPSKTHLNIFDPADLVSLFLIAGAAIMESASIWLTRRICLELFSGCTRYPNFLERVSASPRFSA
jgi:hypothetical protein